MQMRQPKWKEEQAHVDIERVELEKERWLTQLLLLLLGSTDKWPFPFFPHARKRT
jgi:hypothetical protein